MTSRDVVHGGSPWLRRTVAMCSAVLMVAACSSDGEAPEPTANSAWIDHTIEQALAGESPNGIGASAEQLAILERGKAQGELTLADAIESINNAAACLSEQGLWLTLYSTPYTQYGFEIPHYSWGGPHSLSPEELAAVGDPCLEAESHYVMSAYGSQPRAVETQTDYYDEHVRPAMVACLERNGLTVEADATEEELNDMARDLFWPVLEAHDFDNDVFNELVESGRDCVGEANEGAFS